MSADTIVIHACADSADPLAHHGIVCDGCAGSGRVHGAGFTRRRRHLKTSWGTCSKCNGTGAVCRDCGAPVPTIAIR